MGNFFQTYGMTILMLALLVLVFVFMYRSQKKQEKQTNDMRNNLEVGDEITTIGGIIGEIVSIKEETITIETGRDRTKIRVLRSSIRNVDVSAAEKRGEVLKEKEKSKEVNTAKPDTDTETKNDLADK